jgi:hypothetical protein
VIWVAISRWHPMASILTTASVISNSSINEGNWGINISVVDKILVNFDRTAGLFHNILWTKLFTVIFLALSCLGTKGVKEEK